MQWLIDIVKELIHGQLGFFDRGDPTSPDWTLPDFVADGEWRDLDLSAIVPENARVVAFHCQATCGDVSKQIRFRTRGNVYSANVSGLRAITTGFAVRQDLLIACDVDLFVQYALQPGDWHTLELTVKGWWLR